MSAETQTNIIRTVEEIEGGKIKRATHYCRSNQVHRMLDYSINTRPQSKDEIRVQMEYL
jgi:hypothetical protein